MMKTPFTDIRFDLVERLPKKARPFALLMRLDRPAGVWFLLLPCLWGVMLALSGILNISPIHVWYIVLFCIGAIIMRGAGCIINDLWDQNLDGKVERTAKRPLPSGLIDTRKTWYFLGALMVFGLIVLLQFPILTICIGLFSVILVVAYPLMKRITYWPQAFLGLTFNIGALMAWAAVTGIIEIPALLLYFAGFCWTLAYDTIYAYQDIEDDVKIGVKSTALKFQEQGKKWVSIFYGLMLLLLVLAGYSAHAFIGYYIGLAAASYYGYQYIIKPWDLKSQKSALAGFKANINLGLIILLALIFV